MNLSSFDIFILIIIALLGIRVAIRGFVKEVITFAALILALLSAVFFYKPLSLILESAWKLNQGKEPVAFIIIFVLVFIIAFIVEKILHSILEELSLNSLDHILGFFLGAIEGLLIVAVILMAINFISPYIVNYWDIQALIRESFIPKYIIPYLDFGKYF